MFEVSASVLIASSVFLENNRVVVRAMGFALNATWELLAVVGSTAIAMSYS